MHLADWAPPPPWQAFKRVYSDLMASTATNSIMLTSVSKSSGGTKYVVFTSPYWAVSAGAPCWRASEAWCCAAAAQCMPMSKPNMSNTVLIALPLPLTRFHVHPK